MRAAAPLSLAALAACGPSWAPANAPAHPCPRISAAEYERAIGAGAAQAKVNVSAAGTTMLRSGPGIVHCATFKTSTLNPCRRPNDLVIRYEVENGETFHVRVEVGEEYRFRIANLPNTCEILEH
jgi:hypothetical protein